MSSVQTRRNKIEDKSPVLLAILGKGYSVSDACQAAGITRKTVYNWLETAEQINAPDEYVQFYFDFHDARAKGIAKLLKDIDRWENETETVVVERVNKAGEVVQRTTTTKKKRFRPSHFDRARFKLQSQYPDRWGNNTKPDESDNESTDEQSHPLAGVIRKKPTDDSVS